MPLPIMSSLWDFSKPEESRSRMQEVLGHQACQGDYRDELLIQIARTYGLTRDFDQGHDVLEPLYTGVDRLSGGNKARVHLEKGRLFNSAEFGCAPARAQFDRALKVAQDAAEDGLIIDALHMLAILAKGQDAIALHEQAIGISRVSTLPEARRWLGSLLHNQGWAYRQEGRDVEALDAFERALKARKDDDANQETLLVARWSVAMMWRVLGDTTRALEAQLMIAKDRGDQEGAYNIAEIAKCLVALERGDEAEPYITRAIELLEAQSWRDKDAIISLEALRGNP